MIQPETTRSLGRRSDASPEELPTLRLDVTFSAR